MKQLIALALVLALVPMSGCGGSIYANYRPIEELVLIRTVGYDLEENGDVGLAVSSGKGGDELPCVRLAATGPSVGLAVEAVQDLATREELYFPHTAYLLLGERAAGDAARFLDYVERSVQTRMDTPLIVVRHGTAAEAVTKAGGEESEVTEVLTSLRRDSERSGTTRMFTLGETALSLAESGAALCCAVKPITDPNTGTPTLKHDGFAVLREGRLVGWVEQSCARGVTLLLGQAVGTVTLPGGVTVELTDGGAELVPEWDGEGGLASLTVKLAVSAQVTELKEAVKLSDNAQLERVGQELAAAAERWVRGVLSVSRAARADFMGLGRRLSVREPLKWEGCAEEWPALLEQLPIRVSAEAEIVRVQDLRDSANVSGGGK